MAESAGNKNTHTNYHRGDFTDLSKAHEESAPVSLAPRRRKYFDLAYSETEQRSTSAAPPVQDTLKPQQADTKLSPVGINKPFFNIVASQGLSMPAADSSRSLSSSASSTPNTTPQPSPKPSPRLSRPAWSSTTWSASTQADDSQCGQASSSATSEANRKWFGLGSLFETKPAPIQKPARYMPNVQNAAKVKKELEEKLKLYPLPKEPEFFHQKEDLLFMQPIPKPVPRKMKKPRTATDSDKDINVLAPNTF